MFPLEEPPTTIFGFKVEAAISRGFYGAAYKVVHPRTDRRFIVKVIPVKTYSSEEGYNKDFDKEIENHKRATDLKLNVPDLIDAGETEVSFGNQKISCHFIQMDYIDGVQLKDFKNSAELNSSRIAQVAFDLFDFLRRINSLGLHHNDLHDGNVLVEVSNGETGRIYAIDRTVRTYVIDLGSMTDEDRTGDGHLRDISWIGRHLEDMIYSYWNRAVESGYSFEFRTLSLMGNLVKTCFGRENARELDLEGYCTEINNIVKRGEVPGAYPKTLITPSDYYNTQLMPTYYAPDLFYDPDEKWSKSLIKPGPILLTGMRGCGKTILLKSLHFFARAQRREEENDSKRDSRLRNERHLGLFVSGSTLLADPKSKELHLPNHKLILAYSIDLINCLRYCELESVGKIHYEELQRFCSTLKEFIPWFECPASFHDLTTLEMRLEDALLKARKVPDSEVGPLIVYDAFKALANLAQSLVDLWKNKHVIYLLDDLSTRYLKKTNVDEVLSQLCHQDSTFSFKISTETPTLKLRTGAGEISRIDRDFEEFDLGNEVMQELKSSGPTFINAVLRNRLELTREYKGLSPKDILGSQSLNSVAENLVKEGRRKRGSYWGIKTLGAITNGDIGDAILLFHHMLKKMDALELRRTYSIPPKIQDQVIFDYSEKKLRSLANQDKWLYDHAISFAQASQRELKASHLKYKDGPSKKLRQYSEVFLRIDPERRDDIFEKINKLVEAGVFVFAGGTPRSNSPGTRSSLFLKLAYRKILGVTNLMPIVYKDRFELSGSTLENWLNEPTADKLRITVSSKDLTKDLEDRSEYDWRDHMEEVEEPTSPRKGTQEVLSSYMDDLLINKNDYSFNSKSELPIDVKPTMLTDLSSDNISNKHIIGAFGFEDRSIGSWRNILSRGRPISATMILYENQGHKNEIISILKENGIKTDIVNYSDLIRFESNGVLEKEHISNLVDNLPNYQTVIDVTSLNKMLIYLLTSEILKRKGKVGVIHTRAKEYLPSPSEIKRVLEILKEGGNATQFFSEANELVKGEYELDSKMTIWQNRDPGTSVYLVCFISLKYSRVTKLLEELPVDGLDIIYPLSSKGGVTPRSSLAKQIAEILVSENGNLIGIKSNDHVKAFNLLKELYLSYSLESGVNFELGLTGTKMHTVAAGMLGAIVNLSGVYYTPAKFDPTKYTKGTGETTYAEMRIGRQFTRE